MDNIRLIANKIAIKSGNIQCPMVIIPLAILSPHSIKRIMEKERYIQCLTLPPKTRSWYLS